MDFTIEDNCYVNDKFIGTTVAKTITVNIINPDNSIDLENKEIEVYVGVDDELIPYGNFIIDDTDDEEVVEKTNFTGYDYMIKFNDPYTDRMSYPCSLNELFVDLCNQVGLEAGNTDFVNADYSVIGNPFTNNETCKTVLSNIAQLAGGFAKIGRDNKVYIISLIKGDENDVVETIDAYNYFEDFSKNKEWGEVNTLVLSISGTDGENTTVQDSESISENGATEIVIEDNYFLTNESEREKVKDQLWESLKGLKYLPFSVEYYGYPYLDSGDMIYIKDSDDVGYISYVFNHTFVYNGAFNGSLETEAMTEVQTAYLNTVSATTKFRQVERIVDKVNGQIEDIIEQQTDFEYNLTQVVQDISGIRETVTEIAVLLREKTQVENLYLDDVFTGSGYIIKFIVYGNTEEFTTNEITLTVSKQTRGYGDNTYLTTEDGEDILTEDGEELIVGARTFALDFITLTLDDVLRSLTIGEETYYDTLEISQDGKITVTRRIGVDSNGGLYLLDEEEVTILEETYILPSEAGVYYFIEEVYGLTYYSEYITDNDYNSAYATRVELNASITTTAEEFTIELSKKVDETELCSKISVSTEQIVLSGNRLVVDSTNFKLDENGNVTITGVIYDFEGDVLVSDSEILTDLAFNALAIKGNSYHPESYLGVVGSDGDSGELIYLLIDAQIPEDFEIKKAYIEITHTPITWTNYDDVSTVTGYSRNVGIYTLSHALPSIDIFNIPDNTSDNLLTDVVSMIQLGGTEIVNAFTDGAKTFSSTQTETIKTNDLSSYLTSGEQTLIAVSTSDSAVSYTTASARYARTGKARAQLHVIGYLKIEETTGEEKALKLVRRWWVAEYGSTDGVYFVIDNQVSDSIYIVCVRDNDESIALRYFEVDVNAGEILDDNY